VKKKKEIKKIATQKDAKDTRMTKYGVDPKDINKKLTQ